MNKEVEVLIDGLTSIYYEYLPIDSNLASFYKNLLEALTEFVYQVDYTKDSLLLETTPTLKNMHYAEVDASNAVYDKALAKELLTYKNTEQILAKLDEEGLFHEFIFNTVAHRNPLLFAADFYTDFNKSNKLKLYRDYFLRDNRLYFMPRMISELNRNLGNLHAFNIKYNDYVLEANWGAFFPFEMDLLIPRYRYKNVLIAYRRLMSSNMFISDMIDAIELATERSGVNIFDIKSRDISPALYRLYTEYFLSPLDFIVRLQEEHISGKIDTNIILMMINAAKESQTFFWLIYLIIRIDDFEPEDDFKLKIKMYPKDIFEGEEQTKFSGVIRYEDWFFYNPNYDRDRIYDTTTMYDECDLSVPIVTMDDRNFRMNTGVQMDYPWQYREEYAEVRVVDHPEIPRGYVIEDGVLSFDKNKGITEKYEIYGSADGKDFELLETIEHDSAPDKIIMKLQLDSTFVYYKIRALDRHFTSLFSLIKER